MPEDDHDLLSGEALMEWVRAREAERRAQRKAKIGARSMARVLPEGLYVGNAHAAGSLEGLQARGIRHVVNVGGGRCVFAGRGVTYHEIKVRDSPGSDLGAHFEAATAFAHRALRRGEPVLVHCRGGISRSTSVCMALLVRYRGLTLAQARHAVVAARPQARPNAGFWMQLEAWERRVRGADAAGLGGAGVPAAGSKRLRKRERVAARRAARSGR